MRLLQALIGAVRRLIPRTYARVEHLSAGGSFICSRSEAVDLMAAEVAASDDRGEHWTWRDDALIVGDLRITFVRMSPRRFEALNEFAGF